MKIQTLVMFIVLFGISWGGFFYLLVLAMHKESKKHRGRIEK